MPNQNSPSDNVLNPPTPSSVREGREVTQPDFSTGEVPVPQSVPTMPEAPMPQTGEPPTEQMPTETGESLPPEQTTEGQQGKTGTSEQPPEQTQQAIPPEPIVPPIEHDTSQYPPGTFSVPQIANPDIFVRDSGYIPTGYDPVQDWQMEVEAQNNQNFVNTLRQRAGGAVFDPQIGEVPNQSFGIPEQNQRVDATMNRIRETDKKWYLRERFGWNPDNSRQEADGTVMPLIPQLDGDVSTNGIVSQTGQALYDTFGNLLEKAGIEVPDDFKERSQGTVKGVTDFLFRDTANVVGRWWQFTENLGDKEENPLAKLGKTGLSWVLNPVGNIREALDPKGQEEYQQRTRENFQETLGRLSERPKTMISSGDYGNAGALSYGIYVANYMMGLATGAIYDLTDNTIQRWRLGEDPYEGSRFWDAATKGRDFSVLNRWTRENYLSLMEPEGIEPGHMPDYAPREALPGTLFYVNLPENLSATVARANSFLRGEEFTEEKLENARKNSRAWHWATQLAPAMAIEMIGDGGLDRLAQTGAQTIAEKLGKRAGDVADSVASARHAVPTDATVNPARVIVTPPPQPTANLRRGTVTIPDANGNVAFEVKINPQPSGTILNPAQALDETAVNIYNPRIGLADSDKLLTVPDALPRSNHQLGRLANQLSGTDGMPLARISRPMSSNETSVLRQYDSLIFGENGNPLKLSTLETATHAVDADGRAYEIFRPLVPEVSDEIAGITNANAVSEFIRNDELYKQGYRALPASPDASDIARLDDIALRRNVAIAKALDNGQGYDMLRERLPNELNNPASRDAGNSMLSSQLQMNGEMAEASRLETTALKLNDEIRQVETDLTAFPLHRGELLTEQRTYEWSTETLNPELALNNPNALPAPPLPERPIGKLDLPDETLSQLDQVKKGIDETDPLFDAGREMTEQQIKDLTSVGSTHELRNSMSSNVAYPLAMRQDTDKIIQKIEDSVKEFDEAFELPPRDTLVEIVERAKENPGEGFETIYDAVEQFNAGKLANVGDTIEIPLKMPDLTDREQALLTKWVDNSTLLHKGYIKLEELSPIIDKLPDAPGVIHRQEIGRQAEELLKLNPGDTYEVKRLLSFSHEKSPNKWRNTLSDTDAGIELIVKQKSGKFLPSEGMAEYVDNDVLRLSRKEAQQLEVIVKPGTQLELVSKQQLPNGKTAFIMKEVGDTTPKFEPQNLDKIMKEVDEAKVKVRKWNSERIAKIDQEWLHGTASQADIRAVDPIMGGSPSEFGLGIYLTPNYDVAVAAGRKGDFTNKPFTQVESNHLKPKVHKVNVSRLDGVVLGNDVAGADLKRMWEVSIKEALDEAGLPSNAVKLKDKTKIRDLFNYAKKSYYDATGENLPEMVNRSFQQKMTSSMRDVGINGMYVDRNGIKTLVLYNPGIMEVTKSLEVPRLSQLGETLEATRYLEKQAFEQLGDDVSRANYYKAKKDWLDWQLQQTLEERAIKENKLLQLVDDYTDASSDIIKQSDQVTKAKNTDLLDNSPKRVVQENSIPVERFDQEIC